MESPKKKPSFSLNAFIEQTARILRNATKSSQKKVRKFTKENGLSNTNKIHRIALLLRSEAEKKSKKKKKSR